MRILILLMTLLVLPAANAAEYAVVVARNSTIGILDIARLKDIFLRHRNFEGEVRLVPVNLLGEDAARTNFESRVLNMDRDELNRYWITGHFQGIKPPATQASLQSVKAFIGHVDGAIGYLPLAMVDDSLKVIHEF